MGPIKPRVSSSILMCHRLHGRLGVRCFSKYYQVAQLPQIDLYYATLEVPQWVSVEAIDLNPLMVDNLLWLQRTLLAAMK